MSHFDKIDGNVSNYNNNLNCFLMRQGYWIFWFAIIAKFCAVFLIIYLFRNQHRIMNCPKTCSNNVLNLFFLGGGGVVDYIQSILNL